MAKKNYTQAGARRAVQAIRRKMLKLFQDDQISSNDFLALDKKLKMIHGKIK